MSDHEIVVVTIGDRKHNAIFEDVVYSDRTYGQIDAGAIYYIGGRPIFINQQGEVYKYGTSELIGVCEEIKADFESWYEKMGEDENDQLMDEMYPC